MQDISVGLDGANDDDIPATPSIARWGQDGPLRPAFEAASFIRGSEHTAFPADNSPSTINDYPVSSELFNPPGLNREREIEHSLVHYSERRLMQPFFGQAPRPSHPSEALIARRAVPGEVENVQIVESEEGQTGEDVEMDGTL
jgi:hypothetical protein